MLDLPIIKVIINETDETGIEQISFVDSPAMKEQWRLFSEKQKFSTNDDEMILYYPVVVADTPILRDHPFDHYVLFGENEIKMMRNKLFKNNNHNKFNENHGPVKIEDTYVVESWIKVDNNDKSVKMGFDVPNGSWFIGVKVDNEIYWNEKVKQGKFKGLSMESLYELDIPKDVLLEQYTKSLLNMNLSDDVLESTIKDLLKKM
jgi:hypothetical protein